jgi:NAD(P)-dependent dehydrogenase (short-subunit alcohol dehydrogenase family)
MVQTHGRRPTADDIEAISNRTVVITGANSGVGFATAEWFAGAGARVILAARSEEKAAGAARSVAESSGNAAVVPVWGDFRSFAEVRSLAAQILERAERIDVLINNAGRYAPGPREVTEDGNTVRLQVNYLSHFLLTHRLLPKLRQARPQARVINVSSKSHRLAGSLDLNDLQLVSGYTPFKAFCQSKALMILFTVELAKRLAGTNITANALHPGIIRSNFPKERAAGLGSRVLASVAALLMKDVGEAACNIGRLACSPELSAVTGAYFDQSRLRRVSRHFSDPAKAEELWELSLRLTGE